MIPTILNKILTELNSDVPRLDYIRGMVEVLLASQGNSSNLEERGAIMVTSKVTGSNPVSPTSDQEILDARARAAIETVKSMSTEE